MFYNRKDESIDFDRLNDLVDNGMEDSTHKEKNVFSNPNIHNDRSRNTANRYDNTIGENGNHNSKKNIRQMPHSRGDNESPNNRTNRYSNTIDRNENYNSKKKYADDNFSQPNSRYAYRGEPKASKPNNHRFKPMYVINLTPTRIGIVAGSFFAIIFIIFVAGVQIGTHKDKDVLASSNVNNSNANEDILFRSNASRDVISVPEDNRDNRANTIVSKNTGNYRNTEPTRTDIVSMDLLSENRASSHSVATDDINNMINKDLQEMGQSLNRGSQSQPMTTQDALLNSYMNSEPASYIPGEKSTSSSSISTPQPVATKTVSSANSSSSSAKNSEDGLVYYIQVAVVYVEKAANVERDYLRSKDFVKAYVVDGIDKDGSTTYKLKIGQYATKAQAESALYALKALSSRYSDSYIYSDKAS